MRKPSPSPVPVAPAPPVPTPCECGCGRPAPRRFVPGHDAKLKSELIRFVLAGDHPDAEVAEVRAGATALERLENLGWLLHLELSRAARARKAASRKSAKPAAPAPPAAPPAAGDVRTPAGGTVPASVGRLQNGKPGRRARVAKSATA
jgi:hypothetical protein